MQGAAFLDRARGEYRKAKGAGIAVSLKAWVLSE
jgi:hypothetical protein